MGSVWHIEKVIDTDQPVGRVFNYLAPWLRTPEQGADTIVWLAASPDAQRTSGHFWLDRKIRATHVFRHTRDTPRDRRELIRALDALAVLPGAIR
jgi:hypothetical protein